MSRVRLRLLNSTFQLSGGHGIQLHQSYKARAVPCRASSSSYESLVTGNLRRSPVERDHGPTRGPIRHQRRHLSDKGNSKHGARFAFRMTAAFVAKGQRFEKAQSYSQYDSASGQHWKADKPLDAKDVRNQRHASGQDALFMGSVGAGRSSAFGVADGVGGWADQGIDSAVFAHGLCNELFAESAAFSDGATLSNIRLSPMNLLQAAYKNVCYDTRISGGGSTACVAVANSDGVMNVANLGDSGFVQLRLNAVYDHSHPQTHAFNTPFQLSQIPPRLLRQIANFGGKHPLQDMPSDSDLTTHKLRHGDILVFGTDGLWDNLSPEDVLMIVAAFMKERGAWVEGNKGATEISNELRTLTDETQISVRKKPTLQTEIAQSLTTKAKAASLDTNRDGPFAKAIQKAYPREHWSGGKADDICILVVVVLES